MRLKFIFAAALVVLLIMAWILSGDYDLWFTGPVLWFIALWLFGIGLTEYATGNVES